MTTKANAAPKMADIGVTEPKRQATGKLELEKRHSKAFS